MKDRVWLANVGVDGLITLKCILKKQDGRTWTGFIWFSIGTGELLDTITNVRVL
jgi:hypothetical protein